MKKILIILIILVSSCGYTPIYLEKNDKQFSYKKITLNGNKNINKKIINSLNILKNNTQNKDNEIIISSDKKIEETSKNAKGQVASYRTTVFLEITIKENDEKINYKAFEKDFSYNNIDNKFNLSQYQNEVEKNLVGKIIEELIIYMNLL